MRLRPAAPLRRLCVVLGAAVAVVLPTAAVAGAAPAPKPALSAARAAVLPAGGPVSPADVYAYLENPRVTGEGQQVPHALLRPYRDGRSAVADVVEHAAASPWVASLNGAWRLRVVPRPEDVPAGFWAADFDTRGWPTARVPHTWQSDFLDHPMFRNVPEEIWPDDPPRVPRDVNPTGAYVRAFEVPRRWDGRRTFLRFEGVTSGYFVWVNGRYVGYDQGGYTPSEFDVTDVVRPGGNQVAVQVHRWGSGSYMEDVDQWRYSGIFRDVWLYSTPQTRLADLYVTTDLDDEHRDARLAARVDLARSRAGQPGRYRVRGTLLDARRQEIVRTEAVADVTGDAARTTLVAAVTDPAKWSAEDPNLYTLLLELLDPAGRVVHVTAQAVGFREVTVRDRTVLVNGQRILVKGVNRAETDPDTGRYVTRDAQRRDLALMKRLHINAVRTSHYPSDPYWYDLADRHGLWVADEVDIETHSHSSCPTNCLADLPEWQDAFADRFQAMVHRDKNHPSVIFWDTGNEAGLGAAHYAMAQWATAHDPTRLLYHQPNTNPNGDAPFAHVNGVRYRTPADMERRAATTTKPIVMGEYAHAQGNGLGNFDQFWALVRRYPTLQGGFVWDWADANLRQPLVFTPDSSPNRIQAFLVGMPGTAPGHRGQAVALSGLDDFVNTFRDPRLDLTGTALTVDAWVRPGSWSGSFPILTKGQRYGLQMRDERTLEFGVDTGTRQTAAAAVPEDWYTAWHRVTGVYDGTALRLFIDGQPVAETPHSGAVQPGLHEVNVGRNADTQQEANRTRLGHGLVDDVRVYPAALTPEQLAAGADPAAAAVLALDFDRYVRGGDFDSLGVSLSGTDGLVGTDRYLQPETVQLAWTHAPVRFTAADTAAGRVRVHNEQPAGALDVLLRWSLTEPGRVLRAGNQPLRLEPGATVDVDLGAAPANPGDVERWLNVAAVSLQALPWAPKGWRLGYDQFPAGGTAVPGVRPPPSAAPAPQVTDTGDRIVVAGQGWQYAFDRAAGTLSSMDGRGGELLRQGPQLDAYRPPTSNETFRWGTADREVWHRLGLDRLRTTVEEMTASTEPDGAAVVLVRSRAAGPDTAELATLHQVMRYRVDNAGTITLTHSVRPEGTGLASLPYLPRLGFSMRLPATLHRFAWYGRGPQENYNDRRDGTPVGVWHNTVDGEYVRYSRPQAYGNHTDTRWATLSDGRRKGLLVAGDLDVSVTPYDALDRAEYDFQLPLVRNRDWVTLHVEHGETGMGETPNSVLPPFRVPATQPAEYQVTLRPLTAAEIAAGGVPSR